MKTILLIILGTFSITLTMTAVIAPQILLISIVCIILFLFLLFDLDEKMFGLKNHKEHSIIKVGKNYFDIRHIYPASVRVKKHDNGLWYIVMYINGKWQYDRSSFSIDKDIMIKEAEQILKRNIGTRSTFKKEFENDHKKEVTRLTKINKQQAADILGLTVNADAATIKTRSRELLKILHPDKGGSNYLSTQINLARDTLLDP